MTDHARAVVVGIDGSRGAVDAAAWAAEEAVARGLPLRLLAATGAGTDRASAENALRAASLAVTRASAGLEVQQEVTVDEPAHALISHSRTAAMICVGPVGLAHATAGRIGSTAVAVAQAAHCPVAVVRGRAARRPGWIVAEVGDWPEADAVLQRAVDEAVLRGAALRVLATRRARHRANGHPHSGVVLGAGRLERRLAGWRTQYPGLDVQSVAGHGDLHDYLSRSAGRVQLVVVAADRPGGLGELVGSRGLALLRDTDCTILTCDRQRRL